MKSGVSIIIPSIGNVSNIKFLLDSITRQNANKSELEVIIVLNGVGVDVTSQFESIAKSYDYPVLVAKIEERGVNRARNKGLALSKFDIAFFLDDDCELYSSGTINTYLNFHSRYPDIFAFGGGYILKDKHGLFDGVYNYIQMNWFVLGQGQPLGSPVTKANYLLGGNCSLKKPLAIQHELKFDTDIIYGGSELDFFKQATVDGLKLAAIDLDVIHNTKENFFSVGRKVFKQGKGKCLIDRKFGIEVPAEAVSDNGKYKFLRQLYSYCFWLGYYGVSGQRRKIFTHLFKDTIGYLNALRFHIIRKISR